MLIQRDFYLRQLNLRRNNDMIKVITGVRRCGKSFLLFRLFKDMLLQEGVPADHIIEVILDNIENDHLREPHALFAYIKNKLHDNEMYYILLDEIQLVDRFPEVLNSLLRMENTDIYVTGSNSRFLSSDVLTEFRGRGDEVRVWPLSFSEYLSVYSGSEEDAWLDYMTFGGLPRIPSIPSDEQKQKYLIDLFQETYLKDLVEHNGIQNTSELEDLVNTLASQIGTLTNPRKLENTFRSVSGSGITDKTIKNYIQYMREAFLIDTAIRFDIKGRKYIGTPMKVYFVDPGLRNARLGFRQIEEGHLMENIIYNELKRRGYMVDVGTLEIREKTRTGYTKRQVEVDFIACKGNNKYYIQSAFSLPDGEKKAQEERPFLHINDSFKKIMVVGNHIRLKRDENGITTIGIREFLKNENSLQL